MPPAPDVACAKAAGTFEDKELPPMTSGVCGGDTRFQVFARVAHLNGDGGFWGVTIKADVPDDSLTVESWVPIYAGADWHEREAWEMFGLTFTGHPGLRNIYLPSGFEGHPLRKDYPLLSRMVKPWPGIVDVEPLPASDDVSGEGAADSGEGAADTNMSDGGEGS